MNKSNPEDDFTPFTPDQELDYGLLEEILSQLASDFAKPDTVAGSPTVDYQTQQQVLTEQSPKLQSYLSELVKKDVWYLAENGLTEPVLVCTQCLFSNCDHIFSFVEGDNDNSPISYLWGNREFSEYVKNKVEFNLKSGLHN